MKTKSKSIKRKATFEDQVEHHSTAVHKKANLSTSGHMCGDEGASSVDPSATGSLHNATTQLSSTSVDPLINHNHQDPHVCVNNNADLHLIYCTSTKGISPVPVRDTQQCHICAPNPEPNYSTPCTVTESITTSSANMHSVRVNCCTTPPPINKSYLSTTTLPYGLNHPPSIRTEHRPSSSIPLEYIHMGQCTCMLQWWSRCVTTPPEYPEYIKRLYADAHFMENIRAYNQMFSMTSLGANVDSSINHGKVPYVFRISGRIYYWIGSMCPEECNTPRFLQLYIYDTTNEVSHRMAHFGGENQSGLKREIVEGLIEFLDNHNALVQLFRTTRNKQMEADVPEFKVKLYNIIGTRCYDLPTPDTIGAIHYVVTAYCAVEQSLLDYIRQNQSDIRNEYLSGLYDAILRGDHDSNDLETRTVLTASFTGGPSVSSKVKEDADVDKYISAELPDPIEDPDGYRIISELMMHGLCDLVNKNAPCMKDGNKCNRNFPKPYSDKTYIDKDRFVHYRRRETGIETERSFRDIRIVNDIVYPTNRPACEALGLIGGDQERISALEEASLHSSSNELKKLFVQIIIFCDVSDPMALWQKFWKAINYNRKLLLIEKDTLLPKLNTDQKLIFDEVVNGINNREQKLIFVYGHGGTCKTFLWKSIACDQRLEERIVLAVATSGEPDETDTENLLPVNIPTKLCILDNDDAVNKLISFIYDEQTFQTPVAEDLQKKVIVCPKNETKDTINSHVLSLLNHERRVYPSSDEATPHGNDGGETELIYPNEYLNILKFAGLPPHALELKVGAPIILLRNLNLTSGLCNGTRMIITQLLDRVIEARIITGTRVSEKVFLLRILLINRDLQMSFVFKRKQFPVKLSYAMIINKSQGQSLEKIGKMAEPSEIQSKADKQKLVLFEPEIINLRDITLATQPIESKKKRKITPKIESGPMLKTKVTKRLTNFAMKSPNDEGRTGHIICLVGASLRLYRSSRSHSRQAEEQAQDLKSMITTSNHKLMIEVKRAQD
ncbi:DNA helicase [Tanacetum coccineum]